MLAACVPLTSTALEPARLCVFPPGAASGSGRKVASGLTYRLDVTGGRSSGLCRSASKSHDLRMLSFCVLCASERVFFFLSVIAVLSAGSTFLMIGCIASRSTKLSCPMAVKAVERVSLDFADATMYGKTSLV